MTSADHVKAPRRRRWPWIVAGILALVVVAVALGPTLLSTSAGNRVLLRLANGRIDGHVDAEHISVGWFSGFRARNVTLTDPAGKLVLRASRIDTELSLLEAGESPMPLGKSRIDVQNLDVVAHPDGSTSLSRATGQKPAPAESEAELPFTGELRLSIDEASWGKAGKTPLRITKTTGQAVVENGRLAVDLGATVDAPSLPPSAVRAHVRGELDTKRRVLKITEPSTVAEGKSNRLDLATGTVLSWGDEPNDATVLVTYDLQRLSALFSPFMPSSLSMAGRSATKIHVRGALAEGVGASRLRGLTIDPTSFAYDRIEASGLTLTNGRIPIALAKGLLSFDDAELAANGGTVVLAGHIDLNGPTPRYVLDAAHTVAKGLVLNDRMARGPLRFLPIAWGIAPKSSIGGLVTAHLDSASLPLSKEGLTAHGRATGKLELTQLDVEAPLINSIAKRLGPLAKAATVHDEKMTVPFVLEDGHVHLEGVGLRAGTLQLTLSGNIGLDGALDAKSSVKVGSLTAPVSVGIAGTVQKPQFDVKTDLKPSDLQEQLKEAPGLLEKLFDKTQQGGG